jgi:hypothetical protein
MPIGRKFGQHEPLTTRLHNLVRSYPKGLGVLKEFVSVHGFLNTVNCVL